MLGNSIPDWHNSYKDFSTDQLIESYAKYFWVIKNKTVRMTFEH